MTRNRIEEISLMSSYDNKLGITIHRKIKPGLYRSKTYNPGPASTRRAERVLNEILHRTYNPSRATLTFARNTIFLDIDSF